MTRKHNYAASRSTWSQDQFDLMNDLIDAAEKWGHKVPWREYEDQLGHPYSSIITMASRLRASRNKARMRAENAVLRAACDALASADDAPPPPPKPKAIASKLKLSLDSERITTSTQHLLFAAEMRNRIDPRNITAGVFGDPPPGRSALDRKRAGIPDTPH